VKAKELVKKLIEAGWVFARQCGSHAIFKRGPKERPITVPMHSKDLKTGTAKAIMKQAGLK